MFQITYPIEVTLMLNPIGRPPGPEPIKQRPKYVGTYLTDNEYDELSRRAESQKLSRSTLIRQLVQDWLYPEKL